jgi:hypothetical protein
MTVLCLLKPVYCRFEQRLQRVERDSLLSSVGRYVTNLLTFASLLVCLHGDCRSRVNKP